MDLLFSGQVYKLFLTHFLLWIGTLWTDRHFGERSDMWRPIFSALAYETWRIGWHCPTFWVRPPPAGRTSCSPRVHDSRRNVCGSYKARISRSTTSWLVFSSLYRLNMRIFHNAALSRLWNCRKDLFHLKASAVALFGLTVIIFIWSLPFKYTVRKFREFPTVTD